MKYFSMLPIVEIEHAIDAWNQEKHTRSLQKMLAVEITGLIHGTEAVERIERINAALFSGSRFMPDDGTLQETDFEALRHEIPANHEEYNPETIIAMSPEESVMACGLVKSKGEARRLAQQNGITTRIYYGRYLLVRKGKKEYGIVA